MDLLGDDLFSPEASQPLNPTGTVPSSALVGDSDHTSANPLFDPHDQSAALMPSVSNPFDSSTRGGPSAFPPTVGGDLFEPAQPAGSVDAWFTALLVKDRGVLYEDQYLQVRAASSGCCVLCVLCVCVSVSPTHSNRWTVRRDGDGSLCKSGVWREPLASKTSTEKTL